MNMTKMTQEELMNAGYQAAVDGQPCEAPTTRERDRAAWEQGWRAHHADQACAALRKRMMTPPEETAPLPAAQIVAANLGYDAVAPKGWTSVETSTEDTPAEDPKIAERIRQIARMQRIKDAIEAITNELNGGNRRDVAEAILDAILRTHRTLQQDFWSAILYAQMGYAGFDHDMRNAEAVKMAKAVTELAQKNNWDLGLPRI
jgi:ribosome modulation factor